MPHANPGPDLQQALWSDLPPAPAPGELPLLAHCTSIEALEHIAQTGESQR